MTMADTGNNEGKKGSLTGQVLTSVVIALLVGGTSPWWVSSLLKKTPPGPTQATLTQPASGGQQPAVPAATQPAEEPINDFFVGRWRVDQEIGDVSGGNVVDYDKNGRFSGKDIVVAGTEGRKIYESGTWEVVKLSAKTFRLTLRFDNGTQWTSAFRILDHDHIQNIDENYVAERVE